MKKLFYIFAILFTVFNTTAWGDDDTKTITVEWTLRLPEKNYSGQINSGLYVYDQDEQCTIKDQDPKLIGTKHENKSWHYGISFSSKQSQGSTKLLCPKNLTSLTLVFDFNNGKGIVHTGLNSTPLSANAASFTKTFDISKQKKIKIDETIETIYDMQNRLTREAAQNFCIDGTFSRKNYAFCCTKGIKNNDTNGLQNALNKIAGTNMIQIDNSCQNNTADERQRVNQEYADALRNPDNWQKHEAQPAIPAPRTDAATSTETITVSGTVNDNTGPAIGAHVYAIDSDGKTMQATNGPIGAATDIDGHFEIKNFPSDARLQISYVGFETQIFTVDQWNKKNNKTTLQEGDGLKLKEVTVKSCKAEDLENLNASDFQLHYDSNTCIPKTCKTGYTLVTTDNKPYTMSPKCQDNVNSDECAFGDFGIKCLKTTGNCATDKHADTSEYVLKEGTYVCEIKTCKSGYKPNDDGSACIKMAKKCNDDDRKKLEDAGASDTGLRAGTEICIALDCKCGYTLNGEKCDPWEKDKNGKYTKPCEKSDLEKLNAKSGILACNDRGKAFCEITECISSDYTHNTEKNTCDSKNKTPCDTMPENATDAEYRTVDGKLVCIINKCADGYERNADKTKCNPTPKLSQEDSKKKIAELQENADAMRAKEQSTENKLLGGATMAATGIGGMQAMSALAEQSADEDAERAMRAYLATFHCNYGGGINIPGGEKDVQLPGGNELVGLYSEYVNLANDLKVRKNALGMKPGIESESILDSATSGLYDDVAIGKTSGAFTSLARAMMDPNGADAAAWAAQKSDTAKQLKTGATIAGIGAVGGAVGNLLINKNAPKENSKEINKKYDALKKLESDVAQIPPQTAKCPSGTSGNAHPDCTCNDKTKIFNPNTNACDACPGNKTVINGKCDCPTDKPLWDTQNNTCIAKPTNCTPQCSPAEGNHLRMLSDCSCTCIDGYDLESGSCVCKSPKSEKDGKCIEVQQKTIIETIKQQIHTTIENATLPAGSLFKIGSYELVPDAKTALSSFIDNLAKEGYTNCKLTINGYTDPIGAKNTNQKLSENRAEAVKNYFKGLNKKHVTSIDASGHGESGCTCGTREDTTIDYSKPDYKICQGQGDEYTVPDGQRFAPCRRVEITANCQKITTETQ